MALRILLIIAFIVGIVVYKETRPKKVKTVIVKKTKVAPAPVQPPVVKTAEIPVEEKKEPEGTLSAPKVEPVIENTPAPTPQVTPEPVVTEVMPEPAQPKYEQPSPPIEKPAIPKVTFTPFKRNEVLSAEDKIIDLKETVPHIRTDLEEIYKNKTLSKKYSTDKVTDLTIDAVQYLSDPEEFKKKSSEEVIKNTKEFLLHVEKIRKKYEVRR